MGSGSTGRSEGLQPCRLQRQPSIYRTAMSAASQVGTWHADGGARYPIASACRSTNLRADCRRLLGLLSSERSHVDGEAVLHIRFEQPFVGVVHGLDGNDLDVCGDAVLTAEIEHL